MTPSPAVARLFLAVPLPADARTALWSHIDTALRGRRLPGRVVRPDSWHLTLRFLGDTSRQECDAVLAHLRTTDLGASFRLAFTSLGAFPVPERARVLWIGTGDGAGALAALAAHAERAAVMSGFEPERRPFAAHLTLSRLRPEEDVRAVVAAVPPFGVGVTVDQVVLFRSDLDPGGARYTPLSRLPLARGPAER